MGELVMVHPIERETGRSRVLVIVPAYNEAASIISVITSIRARAASADILVVDDGSKDATAQLARAAGAIVASLPFNLGVGGAMRAGYRYARDNDYDVTVQVDADGQHDPAYIPRLLQKLGSSDIVIGARFAGECPYDVGLIRRWTMAVLAFLLSSVTRTRLTDVTSGFRATNRRGIELFAQHFPAEYLGDTVESLILGHRAGLKVAQVPVRMSPRLHGNPSQSIFRATLYTGRATAAILLGLTRRPAVVQGAV